MDSYPKSVAELIEEFEKLPSIGHKTAVRLAFHVLNSPMENAKQFSDAIINAKVSTKFCSICGNMSETDICGICGNEKRDKSKICVVSEVKDLLAMERTHEFNGVYHILQGVISPINNIGPDDIKIKELLARLDENVKEIILAINPSIEGEVTSLYLKKILEKYDIKISRLSYGIPMGGDMEYLDPLMISKALDDRKVISW